MIRMGKGCSKDRNSIILLSLLVLEAINQLPGIGRSEQIFMWIKVSMGKGPLQIPRRTANESLRDHSSRLRHNLHNLPLNWCRSCTLALTSVSDLPWAVKTTTRLACLSDQVSTVNTRPGLIYLAGSLLETLTTVLTYRAITTQSLLADFTIQGTMLSHWISCNQMQGCNRVPE